VFVMSGGQLDEWFTAEFLQVVSGLIAAVRLPVKGEAGLSTRRS